MAKKTEIKESQVVMADVEQEQNSTPVPEQETQDLAPPSQEPQTALAVAEQVDNLFGETPDIPTGSLPPQIKIVKDSGKFDTGEEQQEKELTGHILFIQQHNVFYEGKYDPSDPQPPMCSSSNGIKPDGGTDIQNEVCSSCPQNKHDKELGCRPCKNRVLIYFLRDGAAFPSIIDLAATNLSKKAGEQRIMTFAARAMNKAYAAGLGKHFEPVKVALTLNTVVFGNGSASTLNVACTDVVRDIGFLKQLAEIKHHVQEEYKMIAAALAQEAMGDTDNEPSSDDDCPI